MNFVQPIRDLEQIQQLKEYFRGQNERNYILFVMGINTGLRISDILKLTSWTCFLVINKLKPYCRAATSQRSKRRFSNNEVISQVKVKRWIGYTSIEKALTACERLFQRDIVFPASSSYGIYSQIRSLLSRH